MFKKYQMKGQDPYSNHYDTQNLWIVKPSNLSRGRGIYIVDNISEVNIDEDQAII